MIQPSFHLTQSTRQRRCPRRRAFTLIELMVVVSIIVLALAMAVPLVHTLNGTRSIEAGFNSASAALAHARELALATQQPAGAFFYVDPNSGGTDVAFVQYSTTYVTSGVDSTIAGSPPYLDLIEGEETIKMPPGVGVRVFNCITPTAGSSLPDRYLAYGAIMFDADGHTLTGTGVGGNAGTYDVYRDGASVGGSTTVSSALSRTLHLVASTNTQLTLDTSGAHYLNCLPGLAIYDRTAYLDQVTTNVTTPGVSFNESDVYTYASITNAPTATTYDKQDEEKWIDQNAELCLVKPNDGTLVQSK